MALSGSVHISRVLGRLRQTTHVLFGRHLLLTNIGISISLSATGDVIQQQYHMVKKEQLSWDSVRTRNMAVSGCTVGILCHYWYLWLDRRFPGRTMRIVVKKVIIDQFVLSPVAISLFFLTVGIMERVKMQEIGREILQKGYRLYLAEFFVWPVAQVISFAFLPTKFRVLYDNTISLGFDIYTSYVKHEID